MTYHIPENETEKRRPRRATDQPIESFPSRVNRLTQAFIRGEITFVELTRLACEEAQSNGL